MKRACSVIVVVVFLVQAMRSQDVKSMYFLNNWTQRYTVNPAFAAPTGHFSLPLLGGMELASWSNVGLASFIYSYKNQKVTFMHSSVNGAKFIAGLDDNSYMNQTATVNLLSFGLRTRYNGYWSFGCNFKENMFLNVPLDFFKMTKLGFEHKINYYNLQDLKLTGNSYIEFSAGYSNQVNSKLRIGSTLKFLGGLWSQKLSYSQFDVTLTDSKYEAVQSGESYIINNKSTVSTDAQNRYDVSQYSMNVFGKGFAGMGGAIDIGASYQYNECLSISAALNNLGFIHWGASSILHGLANETVNFTGFSNIKMDSLDMGKQFDQLTSDLKRLLLFKKQSISKGITERIPANLNVAAEYRFMGSNESYLSGGLLWNSYNSPSFTANELITSVNMHPANWFTASVNYSFLRKDTSRLGLALNFSPDMINFWLATDFVTTRLNPQLIPIKRFNINIQTGFSLYLGD